MFAKAPVVVIVPAFLTVPAVFVKLVALTVAPALFTRVAPAAEFVTARADISALFVKVPALTVTLAFSTSPLRITLPAPVALRL